MSAISDPARGGLFWGISALPPWAVINSTRWLSAGLPGTMAGSPDSPPLSIRSKLVITYAPPAFAG